MTKAVNVRSGRTPKHPANRAKPNQAPVAHLSVSTIASVSWPVTVSTAATADPDGALASGQLDWGDGTTVIWLGPPQPTYSHTYASIGTYTITLNVVDDKFLGNAMSCTITFPLPSNPPPLPVVPPTALLTYVSGQYRGLPYVLSTAGTSPGTNALASGTIDWGDQLSDAWTGSPPATLTHTYQNAGSYIAVLTVLDTASMGATASRAVDIASQVLTNQPPTAALAQASLSGLAVVVSTAGTGDPENNLTSGSITWGDGQTTSFGGAPAATYSHTYATAATFTVTLQVIDGGAATASASISVTTVSIPVPPGGVLTAADFSYIGCVRLPSNWSFGALGGISGRIVGGKDHLFLYGLTRYYKMVAAVSAATSASAFRLGSVSAQEAGGIPVAGKSINITHTTGTAMPQTTVIQTVTPNGSDYDVTVSPALSGTPTIGDYVWADQDPIVEIEIPTTGITKTWSTTVQAAPIAFWIAPYAGKKVSWRGGNPYIVSGNDPGGALMASLYYHDATGLLYWTYYDGYAVAGEDDWGLGASLLGAPSTVGGLDGSVTSYGPWRVKTTDGDGANWYGPERFGIMASRPSGGMIGTGVARSGIANVAWGPVCFGGSLPTAATPGGFAAADLTMPDRYLNYYYPTGGNTYTFDGHVVGVIRQYQHVGPTGYSIIFEPDYAPPRNAVNPAFNNGIATWNAGADAATGLIWLQGASKNCVLYSAVLALSPNLTSSNINANHTWYRSPGQYTVYYTNRVGTFTGGETIIGNTSAAQMTGSQPGGDTPNRLYGAVAVGQEFLVGETIHGATSGATAQVTIVNRHDICFHGFTPPGGLAGITGDVSTHSVPAFLIFDAARLETNKSGGTTDYTTQAAVAIDLEAAYGIETAGQGQVGAGKQLCGFWYNSTTRRLYCVAPQADLTFGTSAPQSLVHIFEIRAGAL